MHRANDVSGQLVPRFILEALQHGRRHGRMQAICLFIDIAGFTALTHRYMRRGPAGAEALNRRLNGLLEPLIALVYDWGGFIAGFSGDSFLALFPAGHVEQAGAAALAMRECVSKHPLAQETAQDGPFARIGMSAGAVEWAIVGKPPLLTYLFRGPAVEQAVAGQQLGGRHVIIHGCLADKAQNRLILHRHAGWYALTGVPVACSTTGPKPGAPAGWERVAPFIAEKLRKFGQVKEFREAAVAFLSWPATIRLSALNPFVSGVLALCRELGGVMESLDFLDKGGSCLIYFGAPISYEDPLMRAMKLVSSLSLPGLRVGVTYGTVFFAKLGSPLRMAYNILGDVVNLSARLAMAAPSGQRWVTQAVYQRVKDAYQFTGLGKQRFKGRPGPLPVFRLEGLRRVGWSKDYQGRLVGRQAEMRHLLRFLKPLSEKRCAGICTIYGEAGIGKSRLVHECRRHAHDTSWFLLQADRIQKRSFNAFAAFFHTFFSAFLDNATLSERTFPQAYTEWKQWLSRQLPKEHQAGAGQLLNARFKSVVAAVMDFVYPGSAYEQMDGKTRYKHILLAVRVFFQLMGAIKPMVIVLEDVHNLDQDSEQAVIAMFQDLPGTWALVVTSRVKAKSDQLCAKLGVKNMCTIHLRALPAHAISLFIKQMTGLAPENSLLRFMADISRGNPFYMEQYLDYLQQHGLVGEKGDQMVLPVLPADIPSDITVLILARIDRLPAALRGLVRVAAVLGQAFDTKLLLRVADQAGLGLNGGQLEEAVSQGADAQLWTQAAGNRLLFFHALVQQAVYRMQAGEARRRIHQLAARVLAAHAKGAAHLGAIAFHSEWACRLGGKAQRLWSQAFLYLEQAADYFRQNYRNAEALDHYNRWLALCDLYAGRPGRAPVPLPAICNLRRKRATLRENMGLWIQAKQEFQAIQQQATAHALPYWAIQTRLDVVRMDILQGNYPQAFTALRALEDVFKQNNDQDRLARTYALFARTYNSTGQYRQAMDCYQNALQLQEKVGTQDDVALLLGQMATSKLHLGLVAEAVSDQLKRLAFYRTSNNKYQTAITLGNIGVALYGAGRYQEAGQYFEQALEVCRAIGDMWGISSTTGNLGNIYLELGRFERAQACYQEQYRICKDMADKKGMSMAIGNLGNIFYRRRRLERAQECYQQKLALCRQMQDQRGIALALGNLGHIFFFQRDNARAMAYYKNQLQVSERAQDARAISLAMGNIGECLLKQGKPAAAIRYFEQKQKLSQEMNIPKSVSFALLSISNALASMGKWQPAMKKIEKAAAIARSIDLRYHLVSCLYHKAILAVLLGQFPRALHAIRTGLPLAEETGRNAIGAQLTILNQWIRFGRVDALIHQVGRHREAEQNAEQLYSLYLLLEEMLGCRAEHLRPAMRQVVCQALEVYRRLHRHGQDTRYQERVARLEHAASAL